MFRASWIGTVAFPLFLLSLVGEVLLIGAEPEARVRVPDGFEAGLFADDDLCHDVFSMTTDSQGRIVVSGPGYIRILVDEDRDGRAERFIQFADGPASGAQGMYFHGRDLLCIGDAGLIRYRDRDGDDRADGPPDVFLKLKTGAEHHAHSVQRGPDGWWYLIAGNFAGIDTGYVSLPSSPVTDPQSGTLYRLRPDLSGGEVVADGFRNAYDFAFHRSGDLFTFDSDGERDVSLPWYRPTRVFQILPATHAGWFSRSWKRPDYFADMPPVIGSFGRGSPTGVVCYQHRQFPAGYDNVVFVLDWTYGRVIALRLERHGSVWTAKSQDFMTAVGQFGFAPTDAVVGPAGSLFVCVGGRGTRGGVFKVRYQGSDPAPENAADLDSVLNAPQPLSSWSRAKWVPAARELGKQKLQRAALDKQRSPRQRVRAIEICVELFAGLAEADVSLLVLDPDEQVRARTAWAIGRASDEALPLGMLGMFLKDASPIVRRAALETLLGADSKSTDWERLQEPLVSCLGAGERFVRQSAARVVARMPKKSINQMLRASQRKPQAITSAAMGSVIRTQIGNGTALEVAAQVLEHEAPVELKLEATRVFQMALADVGPGRSDPVFEGYTPQLDVDKFERVLNPMRSRIAEVYPSGDHRVDLELERIIGMLQPLNSHLIDRVLARITDESSVVDDIHRLIVVALIPIDRTSEQREKIAKALAELDAKILKQNLKQDTNWDDRIKELYKRLVKHDPYLPAQIVRQLTFGLPGHVIFLSEVNADDLQMAVDAFAIRMQDNPDYQLSNDVVFVLGESKNPAHRKIVKSLVSDFRVRDGALMVLAERPDATDRPLMVAGLDSAPYEVLEAILKGLSKLPPNRSGGEQVALVKTLRGLGNDARDYRIREQLIGLLRRNTDEDFGYELGKTGHRPQPAVVAAWDGWARRKFPALANAATSGSTDLTQFFSRLQRVNWQAGDVQRGKRAFEKRACSRCHGGRAALGPDLAGAAKRFSRDDLFAAIVAPNRDVSPRYQTTMIQTVQGKVFSGLVVYQSVDGLLLRNASNQTFRIESDDIEERGKLSTSLMPVGLLKDVSDAEIADLYAYIQQLAGK